MPHDLQRHVAPTHRNALHTLLGTPLSTNKITARDPRCVTRTTPLLIALTRDNQPPLRSAPELFAFKKKVHSVTRSDSLRRAYTHQNITAPSHSYAPPPPPPREPLLHPTTTPSPPTLYLAALDRTTSAAEAVEAAAAAAPAPIAPSICIFLRRQRANAGRTPSTFLPGTPPPPAGGAALVDVVACTGCAPRPCALLLRDALPDARGGLRPAVAR